VLNIGIKVGVYIINIYLCAVNKHTKQLYMKTTHFFTQFCAVQQRLYLSTQASALFFFILGEFSASEFNADSIAITNSRICSSIHISAATLRKYRQQLIDAGIIDFTPAVRGKSPALYTLRGTSLWKLDNSAATDSQSPATVPDAETSATDQKSTKPETDDKYNQSENIEKEDKSVRPQITSLQKHKKNRKSAKRQKVRSAVQSYSRHTNSSPKFVFNLKSCRLRDCRR